MNTHSLPIHVSLDLYNFFVVYPLTEKPTNLDPKRPFTSKVEINKKLKRENILEHEPIRIFYLIRKCIHER